MQHPQSLGTRHTSYSKLNHYSKPNQVRGGGQQRTGVQHPQSLGTWHASYSSHADVASCRPRGDFFLFFFFFFSSASYSSHADVASCRRVVILDFILLSVSISFYSSRADAVSTVELTSAW